jgi:hypothetical protein
VCGLEGDEEARRLLVTEGSRDGPKHVLTAVRVGAEATLPLQKRSEAHDSVADREARARRCRHDLTDHFLSRLDRRIAEHGVVARRHQHVGIANAADGYPDQDTPFSGLLPGCIGLPQYVLW